MRALEFYSMEKVFKYLMLQLFCAVNLNAQPVMPRDVVINEIVFNPVKDGYDYVELYNRSTNDIDLKELMIANRNAANEIASVKNISKETFIIQPRGYFVVVGSRNWLKQHYDVPDSAVIVQLSSLPSFPDDQGCVVLLRKSDSAIIDELDYDERWHFKMITDKQGVALERINIDLPSQDTHNWTSASSSSNFGTPGQINSQFRSNEQGIEAISVLPEVFTPDNDGQNDFTSISINTQERGKIANAVIFNAMGRRVRYLLKNEVLGVKNRFNWDGCDDRDQLLPSGIYIIFTQVFDTKGNVTKHRNCVVLDSFPP
jgi:hypothetical protein